MPGGRKRKPPRVVQEQYVPFFSLLDPVNTDLLTGMQKKSGMTMLSFMTEFILKPLAELAVEELFGYNLASEKHPQNLIMIVDIETGLPRMKKYAVLGEDGETVAYTYDRVKY